MCLIAYRPKAGNIIPEAVLNYNRWSNPDGFGVAFRDPQNGLVHEKFGPKDYGAFHDLLSWLNTSAYTFAAHWRKATHGPACEELSHPYPYIDKSGEPMLAFHNGIIQIDTTKNQSDTLAFVERVLRHLPHGWWNDPAISYLVDEAVGWSRLLLMTAKETVFVNRGLWKKIDEILYSVHPFPSTPTTYTSAPAKSAEASANILLPESTSPYVASMPRWYHNGHFVEPITQIDSTDDDDKFGSVVCADCQTEGEYYVIDGTRYIDIAHIKPLGGDDGDF